MNRLPPGERSGTLNASRSEGRVRWTELLNREYAAAVVLVCFGVWLHAADGLFVATMLPTIIPEIGGEAFVSWTVVLYEIGSIVAAASSGLLTLKFGIKRPMIMAAAIFACGCFASALALNMAVMLAGRALQGAGGGGLVAAIGSVIKELRPAVEVVAVQSTACPSLGAALEAGMPTWVQAGETICDGTAVPVVVDEMYPLVSSVVDRVVPVSEDDVRTAIARLALGNKLVVEGSGAMSLAAALGDRRGGPAVCIASGGSIGADRLAGILTTRSG